MIELSKEELEALAARTWHSPVEFCRIYLPDWFPTKMPWVHRGILALRFQRCDFLLDFGIENWRDGEASWTPADLQKILTNFIDENSGEPLFELKLNEQGQPQLEMKVRQNVAVIMPRGFSKTTIMNAANLMETVYHSMDFFLYVSEAGGHAARQLGTIKAELEGPAEDPNNPQLRLVFGEHAPERNSPLKWTEDYIETLKGVMVGATGRGGQVRGFGKRAKRPGIIVCDDLEDSESVLSDPQRKKDSTWFFSTLMPTVRKGGRVFIIGTLLHNDAILNKCIRSPEFTAVRFGAIDRQGDPLWDYMMNLEQIEAKKRASAEIGELQGFFMEFMSEYRDDESRMFPDNKAIYISKPYSSFVGMALVMDPAISEKITADFCAYAVVGIEAGGVKHVIDYYGQRAMDPAAQVEKFFELHERHLCRIPPEYRKHGVEAIAYQKALVHLIKGEQFKRSKQLGMNAYFEIIPIVHGKTGKMARVQGVLKPLYHSGYLTFQTRWADLALQFSEWPLGKKDGPDAVAMAVTLLDPFASLNLGDDAPGIVDTSQPLEALVGGDFRSAP